MAKWEFYDLWRNVTKQERLAIATLKKLRKFVLSSVPKSEIISIYAVGSLIRRELVKNSDVDIYVILKNAKVVNRLNNIVEKNKDEFDMTIGVSTWCLWEFKHNKRLKLKKNGMRPARLLLMLPHLKLIYGKALKGDFKTAPVEKQFIGLIKTFNKLFFPALKKGEIGFSGIIKQLFWLTYLEEKNNGKNPPYHFRKLASKIKNKKHIIHLALKIREKNIKDEKSKNEFLKRLKKHIKELEKKYNI